METDSDILKCGNIWINTKQAPIRLTDEVLAKSSKVSWFPPNFKSILSTLRGKSKFSNLASERSSISAST
jgi:hypothetical protein